MIIGGNKLLSEAMITQLGLASYNEAITWVRKTQVYRHTEKSSELRGIVAPIGRTPGNKTRAGFTFDWQFAIYITQSLVEATEEERQTRIDELSAIADQVTQALHGVETLVVSGKAYSVTIPTNQTPPLDHDALRENKMFIAPMFFTVVNA